MNLTYLDTNNQSMKQKEFFFAITGGKGQLSLCNFEKKQQQQQTNKNCLTACILKSQGRHNLPTPCSSSSSPPHVAVQLLHHDDAVAENGDQRPDSAGGRLVLVGEDVELEVVLAELLDVVVHATYRTDSSVPGQTHGK